jgi:hypothetical protein
VDRGIEKKRIMQVKGETRTRLHLSSQGDAALVLPPVYYLTEAAANLLCLSNTVVIIEREF